MARVMTRFQAPASRDVRVARPVSSLRLGVPVAHGANHLLGHVLGGQRHLQVIGGVPATRTDTARIYTYRHPNCDYIDVLIRIAGDAAQTTWSVTVTAGGGTPVTIAPGGEATAGTIYSIRAPWDSDDTGYQEITVAYEDVAIRMLAIYDVPRASLGSGDTRAELSDATHRRISLMADGYVAESSTSGPNGLTDLVRSAWSGYYPQVVSWWTHSSAPVTSGAGSFGGSGS